MEGRGWERGKGAWGNTPTLPPYRAYIINQKVLERITSKITATGDGIQTTVLSLWVHFEGWMHPSPCWSTKDVPVHNIVFEKKNHE